VTVGGGTSLGIAAHNNVVSRPVGRLAGTLVKRAWTAAEVPERFRWRHQPAVASRSTSRGVVPDALAAGDQTVPNGVESGAGASPCWPTRTTGFLRMTPTFPERFYDQFRIVAQPGSPLMAGLMATDSSCTSTRIHQPDDLILHVTPPGDH